MTDSELTTALEFGGWRFTAPFYCYGCGIEISAEQWAFARNCGDCDSHGRTRRAPEGKSFAGTREHIGPAASFPFGVVMPAESFIDASERDKHPAVDGK